MNPNDRGDPAAARARRRGTTRDRGSMPIALASPLAALHGEGTAPTVAPAAQVAGNLLGISDSTFPTSLLTPTSHPYLWLYDAPVTVTHRLHFVLTWRSFSIGLHLCITS